MKTPIPTLLLLGIALCFNVSCVEDVSSGPAKVENQEDAEKDSKGSGELETATLAAGCYWCVEAVLERTDGIKSVVSGFMGGKTKNPKYEQVVHGDTGHAEVVQLTFDPAVISYDQVIATFWKLHDPTTLNQQGADRGTQYRSAIFYHSEKQKKIAETSKKKYAKDFKNPIVTEITEASEFHKAKLGHQNYLTNNPNDRYNQYVVWPKLKKLGLEKKQPSEK
jgi:peptide-methionine (S)-S-oxide reductase